MNDWYFSTIFNHSSPHSLIFGQCLDATAWEDAKKAAKPKPTAKSKRRKGHRGGGVDHEKWRKLRGSERSEWGNDPQELQYSQ